MNKVRLNTVHLPMACIGSVHLNTIGYPSSKSSGGVVPPEEDMILLEDGSAILLEDGTNLLME